MEFKEFIQTNRSRLVILFRTLADGMEQFQWGLVGDIPIMGMIGAIVKVQSDLTFRALDECPEQALVIAWVPATREFRFFAHKDVPLLPMLGMLETVKSELLASRAARSQGAERRPILGPDGQPMRF